MPIYEYRCGNCKQRVGIFQSYADYGHKKVSCPNCGSEQLSRLITRVRIAKSEDARLEDLADPSNFGDLDENDPKSMAKFMRKMGSEMGEDMGSEFDEVVDRLEAGEDPESIEQSMPDLGGDAGGGLDDDF